MSQSLQLYRLQQVDTQLDGHHQRLKDIEIALSSDAALKKAKQQFENAQEAETQAQLALKKAEQDVQAQQTKIDTNQRRLYSGAVTNPRELEDLQNETGALNRHMETLEELALEAMIGLEDAQAALEAAEKNLAKVREEVAQKNADLSAEQKERQAEVEQLTPERDGLAAGVEPGDLVKYTKLRQIRAGRAVAEVKDKACSACGNTLTASQAQEARSPNQITCCEMCGRILYST